MFTAASLRGLIFGATALALLSIQPASATTYYFTASGGTIPALGGTGYGSLDITTVGSDLKFDIKLTPNWFVDTGTHHAVTFGLTTSGLTISGTSGVASALTTPFVQDLTAGPFTNPGFNANVNYAINCVSAGNGANSCNQVNALIFYVLGAGALSPVLTSDNVFMAIDIFAANVIDPESGKLGTTGTVGATLCTTCAPPPGETPIPGALPLFTSGMGVLGFLGWRRKRRLARQAA